MHVTPREKLAIKSYADATKNQTPGDRTGNNAKDTDKDDDKVSQDEMIIIHDLIKSINQ
jgi:hypothetical protein